MVIRGLRSLFVTVFDREWHFGNVIIGACLVWIAIYWISFLALGSSASADAVTVVLGSLFAATIAVAIHLLRKSRLSPVILILGLSVLLHALPRIWEYIAVAKMSRQEMFVLFPISWLPKVSNLGLGYVVLATVSLVGSFLFTEKVVAKRIRPWGSGQLRRYFELPLDRPLAIAVAAIAVSVVEPYYNIFLGLSAATNCSPDIRFKWLIHFMSPDVAVLVLLFILINFRSRLGHWGTRGYIFLVSLYLLYTVALGSRSGMLRVALLFVFCTLASSASVRFRLRKLIVPAAVSLVVVFFVFSLATRVRELRRVSCESGAPVSFSASVAASDVNDVPKSYSASWLTKTSEQDENKISLPDGIARALDRVGVFDYAVAFPSLNLDPAVLEERFSLSYQAKSVINNLVPGTPYPGAEMMTARMHPMLFRQRTLKHMEENYLSELYTIWGINFVYFGYIGGIVSCFVCGFLTSVLWLKIAPDQGDDSATRGLFSVLFLWGFLYSGIYLIQGFDYTIVCSIILSLQLVTLIFLSRVFANLFSKFEARG